MIEKYNDRITSDYNALPCKTKKQQDFLRRASRINQAEGRPFSYLDFPDYTPNNFRQMVYKSKGKVELVYRSTCGFYRVKGIELPQDKRNITPEPMGESDEVLSMLQTLGGEPLSVHDLKFKFPSDNLHDILKAKGYPVDPTNNLIKLEIPLNTNITAKILVYPNTVQVNLACTFKPLIYGINGVIELTTYLGRLCQHIINLTDDKVSIPSSHEWIVTHYHLGKDGTKEITGGRFEIKWENIAGGLVRFYSKKMPDGRMIPRIEQIKTPHTTVDSVVRNMIEQKFHTGGENHS